MKLISLYIENFGGLSRYSLDFTSGLTVIEEANGFGKTTLAEFIRAMFYGFPRKGKTLDKSRRQKYTPWNGGSFGGNLVFELDGIRYRVERSFGATPKGDTFTLIDLSTGRKSNRFSEDLGLELFQLDGESFERSTYLPQMAESQTLTTDSIRSKLSDLVDDTNDVGNFEKAVAALKNQRSALVNYRGHGGAVAQAGAQITELQSCLHRLEDRQTALVETEQAMERLEAEQEHARIRQEQLREEIRLASGAVAVRLVHRQHRELTLRHEAAEAACREFEQKYPCGIPDWERIDAAGSAAVQLDILAGRNGSSREHLDALRFLEENRERFENRLPTAEELAVCRKCCAEHASLRNRAMELAAKLTGRMPARANPLAVILLAMVTLAAAGLGIVLWQRNAIWSYMALGIGGAALVGCVFAMVRFGNLRRQLQRHQLEQRRIREEMTRLSGEADRMAAQIRAFLGKFGPDDGRDFYARLADLEQSGNAYLRARERVAQWQREKTAYEAEVARWDGVLTAFFESNGLIRQADVRKQLQQLRLDRDDWEEATESKTRLARELAAFRQEHGETLALPVSEIQADPEELCREEMRVSQELNRCGEELLRLKQRKELLLEQLRQIPQLQDELQLWQEKKAADQKKSDLLDDTVAFLEQAKENLSGNYLGPIRRSFGNYLGKLWEDQQALVTADLDVLLERYGQARELGYFSAGQGDMIMLGMRLALVDALFRQEKPFVILDDPFVNLDDDHTARALELLKDLARDRQIVYLTCSSSRSPK